MVGGDFRLMAESRRYEKFRQIVQRNENCKIAFCNLKSEIRIGLIEVRSFGSSRRRSHFSFLMVLYTCTGEGGV